jgi:cyanophycinase-like exopeptidase
VGASNGDDPRFFAIFEAALDAIGIVNRRMVKASFGESEAAFLKSADLILLAGGDVARGWEVFAKTGMGDAILHRYEAGAVLVGLSAGAVQLGLGCIPALGEAGSELPTFGCANYWIDVHDEANDWSRLRGFLSTRDVGVVGIGIPTGAAMAYYPSDQVVVHRSPLSRFTVTPTGVHEDLLHPRSMDAK